MWSKAVAAGLLTAMLLLICRAYDSVDETISLKDVHKFVDEYEVELVARCCRCVGA